jgi:hypothetical protein
MGTDFLPFLYNNPASSDTRLFLTRMTTMPSGINVKLILSPAFMPRLSRIALGIVVWPLLVRVASVLINRLHYPYQRHCSKETIPWQVGVDRPDPAK